MQVRVSDEGQGFACGLGFFSGRVRVSSCRLGFSFSFLRPKREGFGRRLGFHLQVRVFLVVGRVSLVSLRVSHAPTTRCARGPLRGLLHGRQPFPLSWLTIRAVGCLNKAFFVWFSFFIFIFSFLFFIPLFDRNGQRIDIHHHLSFFYFQSKTAN